MKKILIGVSGSIASYKSADIVSYFSKKYDTHVIMTENATNFISPLTFTALTKNKTHIHEFDKDEGISHINILNDVDAFLIAPATANTIAKLANGIADNLLTSTALAYTKKIFIAPAMNSNMYTNSFTQKNLDILRNHPNFHVIDPAVGLLACKVNGIGKLEKVEKIVKEIELHIKKEENIKKLNLNRKKVLVVTGPTQEKIDSVRVVSNISSGKMGFSLADSFQAFNSNVTVLSTKEYENNIYDNFILKNNTSEIFEYIKDNYKHFDVIVMVAAISDIRARNFDKKLKKYELLDESGHLKVDFVENEDILSYLGHNKLQHQKIIGFAAETDNIIENAKKKLENKKADFIILNDVSNNKAFNSDKNEVYIISNNDIVHINEDYKDKISDEIVKSIFGPIMYLM